VDEAEVLVRLLRKYSPSGSEGPAVGEFLAVARALGYSVRRDPAGNGIARRGSGRPRVVFLGHIDTVPGRRPVARAAGRIHGRGAVDAKGPLAAALVAGVGFAGPGTLEVVAAVGEETDSRGARHLARGPGPDALIAGEPSRWDGLTVGYKGDLRVRARFHGARTHYSSPHPTCADAALRWVQEVRSLPLFVPGASPFRTVTCKVVGIESGGDDDEWASVSLDFRIPPGRTTSELLALLPRSGGQPSLERLVQVEAWEADRASPVVRALEAGIRDAGGRPTLWRKSGTSDLNLVASRWKVAGAAYGPGDPHLDHTAREWVSERELRRSVQVLASAFRQLAEESATPRRSGGGGG
jgi:LysW-gamma-L-lysine carboxypeptidase